MEVPVMRTRLKADQVYNGVEVGLGILLFGFLTFCFFAGR